MSDQEVRMLYEAVGRVLNDPDRIGKVSWQSLYVKLSGTDTRIVIYREYS